MRVLADSTLCARPLTPRATCRACLDVCPRGAISIGTEVAVSDACDGCGLCVAACPNGVFETRWGLESDLVAKVTGRGRTVIVACEAAGDIEAPAARVPCLGVVTEGVLVAAALDGVERIEMVHGLCASCLRREGEALFHRAVERTEALAGRLAPVVDMRWVPGREVRPVRRATVSRRGIFSLFAQPLSCAFRREKPENERRRRLLGLLDRSGGERPRSARGLFFDLDVSVACTGCPVCEAVCPMRAIGREEGPGSVLLRFDPIRCTGCDNCRAACPEGAISLKPRDYSLSIPDGMRIMATVPLHRCPSCGTPTGGRRPTCLSCAGREGRLRLTAERTR